MFQKIALTTLVVLALVSGVTYGKTQNLAASTDATKEVACVNLMPGTGYFMINRPTGLITAAIRNNGDYVENLPVRLTILGSGRTFKNQTIYISSMYPHRETTITFSSWTPTVSDIYTVTCSTRLAGDYISSNNYQKRWYYVLTSMPDIGVNRLASPYGVISPRASEYLTVEFQNYGTIIANCTVTCALYYPRYYHNGGLAATYKFYQTNLSAGQIRYATWGPRTFDLRGDWGVIAWTTWAQDWAHRNDTIRAIIRVDDDGGYGFSPDLPSTQGMSSPIASSSAGMIVESPIQRVMRVRVLPELANQELQLYNSIGKKVWAGRLNSVLTEVNVEAVPAGCYVLRVRGTEHNQRLMILK